MDANKIPFSQNNKRHTSEKLVVGSALTGAAIGAAAVFLSDRKNQQKVKKVIDDVSAKAAKVTRVMQRKADVFKKEADEKVDDIRDSLDDISKDIKTEGKTEDLESEQHNAKTIA